MRRQALRLTVALLTLAIGIAIGRDWSPPHQSTAAALVSISAEQELLEIERQYEKAEALRDAAFFERIEADDITLIANDGTLLTKAQAIAEMKTWESVSEGFSDDIRVRVYGDMAVVTGRRTVKSVEDGESYTDQSRWTDVFVRRDGKWQIVHTQVTPIDE